MARALSLGGATLGAPWVCPGRGLLWGAGCQLWRPTLLGSGP